MNTRSDYDRRRVVRMAAIDNLAPDLRLLVHEYGWTVVNGFLQCGVRKPAQIRHLVETILNEFSPTRGTYSKQGIRTEVKPPLPQVAALETLP